MYVGCARKVMPFFQNENGELFLIFTIQMKFNSDAIVGENIIISINYATVSVSLLILEISEMPIWML